MKLLKKILKNFLYVFIALFITANLYVILSGRFYLYKGIYYTYLQGKTGPTIYDIDVSYTVEIKPNKSGEKWPLHKNFNKQKIPKLQREYLEDLDTKAFLVFYRDTLVYEEYWPGHEQKTVSNSFSMAKTIISILIGIAIEEGKIGSLNDKVSQYIPEFKNEGRENITIKNLLVMASGLDWEESGKNPLSDNAESYYGWHLRELVTRQKLISEPGRLFKYQSGNTQLLGFVLEKATGVSIAQYTQEKLWKKIGAESPAFWSLDSENGDERAFCCLFSTARDFGKIGRLLVNEGRMGEQQIIPKTYYTEMMTPADLNTAEGIQNQRYGYQSWIYLGISHPVYYCQGILGQFIITIPEEDIVIVRLGNEKKPNFIIPDHLKDDKEYAKAVHAEIGHPTDLFQYIEIGKILIAQAKD